MKYVSVTIYRSNGSEFKLNIHSKNVLHESQIFKMVSNKFPAYCEMITDKDALDLKIEGYEVLGLKEDAYAYSIYRSEN